MRLRASSCELRVNGAVDCALSVRRSSLATRNSQLAPAPNGFTLLELLIGLVITAMVMLALAGMMTSIAQGWEEGRVNQSTQVQANQIYARVQKVLASAKYVVAPSDGGAAASSIFLWANDNIIADSAAEAGEMELIYFDSATQSIYLYSDPFNPAISPLPLVGLAAVTPAQFMAWPNIQSICLGGAGTSANANALQISSASFYVTGLASTTSLPIIEFSLVCSKNKQTVTLYNTTTLRAPMTPP